MQHVRSQHRCLSDTIRLMNSPARPRRRAARRKFAGERMRPLNISLPVAMLQSLDAIAEQHRVACGPLIRRAIEHGPSRTVRDLERER